MISENAKPATLVKHFVNHAAFGELTNMAPVDHWILDSIVDTFEGRGMDITRELECAEFQEEDGQRYEIVVRPLDADDSEPTSAPAEPETVG